MKKRSRSWTADFTTDSTLEIDFERFCNIMEQSDLGELGTESVFKIFDLNEDGKINIQEFLLTLLALRPPTILDDSNEDAKLYFDIFDVDENNYIDQEELKAVCTCLFGNSFVKSESDKTLQYISEANWDDLFKSIDVDPKDGKIDFPEFKKWYEKVIRESSHSL